MMNLKAYGENLLLSHWKSQSFIDEFPDCMHLVPGVLPQMFPRDKWKSATSLKRAINTSYKACLDQALKAQFYYSFLSLSGITSSLGFQVIIVFCT